jgi:hypothetical protein
MKLSVLKACRVTGSCIQKFVRGAIPVAIVTFVFILSLFAGAIISSIFVHAVEF